MTLKQLIHTKTLSESKTVDKQQEHVTDAKTVGSCNQKDIIHTTIVESYTPNDCYNDLRRLD